MSSGEYVLDPLTTLCKLALLNFYPEGTKFVIEQNELSFSQPTSMATLLRSVRSLYDAKGYSRESLCHLRRPLIRAVQWYSGRLPSVVLNAELGLRKLIATYERDVDGGLAAEALRFCLLIISKSNEEPSLLTVDGDERRAAMLGRLKAQWTDAEVTCLESWFNILNDDTTKQQQISMIENFLMMKQAKLHDILRETCI